jgi:hypothetical protein
MNTPREDKLMVLLLALIPVALFGYVASCVAEYCYVGATHNAFALVCHNVL